MTLSRILRAAAALAVTALGLSACGTQQAAPASGGNDRSTSVVVGLTYIPNVQFAPAYVAVSEGIFTDNGVDASVRHHGSDEGLFTALLAGEEDVVIASGDEAAVASTQGMDLVSIGSYYRDYPGTVIVRDDSPIQSLADLKGATIGIPGEYGSNWYATLAALQGAGLTLADVTVSSIGYTQQAALTQGDVDAVVGFSNNDLVQMRLAGLDVRSIGLPDDAPLIGASIITTRAWAASHPDQARGVVASLGAAMEAIHQRPDAAIEATMAQTGTDSGAEAAARAVLEATDPLWVDQSGSANTAQDLERWGMMADFLRQINAVTTDIDVSSVVTNDYAAAPRSS